MKRTAARILLFLLIGAVVNVAVAWGLALRAPILGKYREAYNGQVPSRRVWPVAVPTYWLPPSMRWNVTRIGYDRTLAAWREQLDIEHGASKDDILPINYISPRIRGRIDRIRAGWPLLAFESLEVLDVDEPNLLLSHLFKPVPTGIRFTGWRTGFEWWPNPPLPSPLGRAVLPVAPLWPALAVDTVFWGVLCYGALFGPFALRRWIRRRRNLCPHCAYPVGTSPVCTECGKPVAVASLGRGHQRDGAEGP